MIVLDKGAPTRNRRKRRISLIFVGIFWISSVETMIEIDQRSKNSFEQELNYKERFFFTN